MSNLNSNDYKILESIVDVDNNRGLSKGRGSTKKQIVEKTGLSIVKVNNTLKVLLEKELIEEGIKKVRAKTFYISEKGVEELRELRKNIVIL